MKNCIVDTNVIVIANRQNEKACLSCVDACIEFIIDARANKSILLDSNNEIRAEYAGALNQGRPYQLGAQFLMHIYQHQFNENFVQIVHLALDDDGTCSAFPKVPELETFDLSDRKFAALSKVTGVPVTNAVDSDWVESLAALQGHGIEVEFLCGSDPVAWFNPD